MFDFIGGWFSAMLFVLFIASGAGVISAFWLKKKKDKALISVLASGIVILVLGIPIFNELVFNFQVPDPLYGGLIALIVVLGAILIFITNLITYWSKE